LACSTAVSGFSVTNGTCVVSGNCVASPGYPQTYGDSESCNIVLTHSGKLTSSAFFTETSKDILNVRRRGLGSYSGRRRVSNNSKYALAGLKDIYLERGEVITWDSDSTGTAAGWQICSTCPEGTFSWVHRVGGVVFDECKCGERSDWADIAKTSFSTPYTDDYWRVCNSKWLPCCLQTAEDGTPELYAEQVCPNYPNDGFAMLIVGLIIGMPLLALSVLFAVCSYEKGEECDERDGLSPRSKMEGSAKSVDKCDKDCIAEDVEELGRYRLGCGFWWTFILGLFFTTVWIAGAVVWTAQEDAKGPGVGFYCPAGEYCSDGSDCVGILCPAGHYCRFASANGTVCPIGTYMPSLGASKCTDCPLGYTTEYNASISSANCSICNSDYYMDDSGTCTSCPEDQNYAPIGTVGIENCHHRVPALTTNKIAWTTVAVIMFATLLVAYVVLILRHCWLHTLQMSWTTVCLLGFTYDGFFVFFFMMVDCLSDWLYFLTQPFYYTRLKWGCFCLLMLPQILFIVYLSRFVGQIKQTSVYDKLRENLLKPLYKLTKRFVLWTYGLTERFVIWINGLYGSITDWSKPWEWGTWLTEEEQQDPKVLSNPCISMGIVFWNILLKPILWLLLGLFLLVAILLEATFLMLEICLLATFLMSGLFLFAAVSLFFFVLWVFFGFVFWNFKLFTHEYFGILWFIEVDAGSKLVMPTQILLWTCVFHLLLSDVPQFMLQVYNNDLMGEWSVLACVSIIAQIICIVRLIWEMAWQKLQVGAEFVNGDVFEDFIASDSLVAWKPKPKAPEEHENQSFAAFDTNGDGVIDAEEFQAAVASGHIVFPSMQSGKADIGSEDVEVELGAVMAPARPSSPKYNDEVKFGANLTMQDADFLAGGEDTSIELSTQEGSAVVGTVGSKIKIKKKKKAKPTAAAVEEEPAATVEQEAAAAVDAIKDSVEGDVNIDVDADVGGIGVSIEAQN